MWAILRSTLNIPRLSLDKLGFRSRLWVQHTSLIHTNNILNIWQQVAVLPLLLWSLPGDHPVTGLLRLEGLGGTNLLRVPWGQSVCLKPVFSLSSVCLSVFSLSSDCLSSACFQSVCLQSAFSLSVYSLSVFSLPSVCMHSVCLQSVCLSSICLQSFFSLSAICLQSVCFQSVCFQSVCLQSVFSLSVYLQSVCLQPDFSLSVFSYSVFPQCVPLLDIPNLGILSSFWIHWFCLNKNNRYNMEVSQTTNGFTMKNVEQWS